MRAIQIDAFGKADEVAKLVNVPEPPSPGSGEAIVGVEFSPINFNDLLLLRGTFHYVPALPTVVGNEGVGTVEAIGPGVANVKVGDRVLVPIYANAWRERVLLDAGKLVSLPPEGDPKQFAMLRINPVGSHLLLTEYGNLKPGDFVIQNAANSGVGRGVIAFGQLRGLRVINVVRRADVVAEVEAAGGEFVLVDGEDLGERVAIILGGAELRVALDGVGGTATARLASTLSPGGHLVGYSFMGGYDVPLDLRPLLDRELQLHSFYQVQAKYDTQVPAILAEATRLIASGKLSYPVVAIYPLKKIGEAIRHAERGGKVLLDIKAA